MKLSFIIPIYNVEKYLPKCVDSLLNQNYDDYEIILVDDGSTDNSGDIADKLAVDNAQCTVIHQNNRGLSGARNAGLKIAKGEYVCFVDSDDYWEPNVLDDLMEQIERDKLDVLRFKYQNVRLVNPNLNPNLNLNANISDTLRKYRKGKNDSTISSNFSRDYINYEVFTPYKTDQFAYDDYSKDVTDGYEFLNNRLGLACYACAYILKADIARKEQFTEGIYFEDTDWTPRMLLHARRIASTDCIVYNYLMREGSITNAVNKAKQRKVLDEKIRLVATLSKYRQQAKLKGHESRWYDNMIAATVISIFGMLSEDFWKERSKYLKQLKQLSVFPLKYDKCNHLAQRKARLMNFCPLLALWLLRVKNW